MGVIQRIKEKFNKRSTGNVANPPLWLSNFFSGGISNTGLNITEDDMLKVSAVYACINLISNTIASLPFPVYERKERGRERARDHYLYKILQYEPNPEMTSFDFRKFMQYQLELFGNAYANIVRDNAGRAIELWPIPSMNVRPRRNANNQQLIYDVMVPGDTIRTLLEHEILHLRGLGDGLLGYPPLKYAREIAALALAAEGYGAGFFANGAVASGIVEMPGKVSEEAKERFKKSFREQYEGLGNKHRIVFLEEGLKFHQTTVPQDNAQFIETRKYQVEEVARFFAVPPHKIASLDRSTYCLPADALIFTERGPVKIVDVKPGEKVWSRKENGDFVLSRVARVVESGEDKILTIRTKNRKLRLNSRHRVLARKAYLRPAQEGETGGINIDGKFFRKEWKTEYVPAGELKVGDLIVQLAKLPDVENNEAPTRIVDEAFMEFLGLYLGDGSKTKKRICITRANNAGYMDHFRKTIPQIFSKFSDIVGRGDTTNAEREPVKLIERDKSTTFCSVEASNELDELGLSGTAWTKRVPEWIFSLSDNLKIAFLRGFLEADGHVDKNGSAHFYSVNLTMLEQLRHLAISVGLKVTTVWKKSGIATFPNGHSKRYVIYKFSISDAYDVMRISPIDPKDRERVLKNKKEESNDCAYRRSGGIGFNEKYTSLGKITSIEEGCPETVYDMEVEETHSFVADGVVVHNSNIEHQAIEFVQDCIRPRVVNWEQQVHKQLLRPSEKSKYYAEFVLDGLLRGDVVSRAQYYQAGRNSGWLSANDIRELENMNPIPPEEGGDAYLVNGNMTRIG